jgi:hypothetical protein
MREGAWRDRIARPASSRSGARPAPGSGGLLLLAVQRLDRCVIAVEDYRRSTTSRTARSNASAPRAEGVERLSAQEAVRNIFKPGLSVACVTILIDR